MRDEQVTGQILGLRVSLHCFPHILDKNLDPLHLPFVFKKATVCQHKQRYGVNKTHIERGSVVSTLPSSQTLCYFRN